MQETVVEDVRFAASAPLKVRSVDAVGGFCFTFNVGVADGDATGDGLGPEPPPQPAANTTTEIPSSRRASPDLTDT